MRWQHTTPSAVNPMQVHYSIIAEYPSTIIVPLLLAAALCTLLPWAVVAGANTQEHHREDTARQVAHDVANSFESQLRAAYGPVKFLGIMAELMPNWGRIALAFPLVAAKLMEMVPADSIMAFKLMPFGVIRHVYPETERNLASIGTDLFSLPAK